MRPVSLTVSGTPNGKGRTWAYPNGKRLGNFEIPTYELIVTGKDNKGQSVRQPFKVFRFGVQCEDGQTTNSVGLAESQTHVIKRWIPDYPVHSANTLEIGAWQVYGNFLIHDGPDNDSELFATIGCIEIMGPNGFTIFNDLIIALSGPTASTRDKQLLEIGRSGQMKITYLQSTRPPVKPIP